MEQDDLTARRRE